MTGSDVDTVEALESVVGATPAAMHLKVIDHLDAGALRWIADTPLILAAFAGPDDTGIQVTLAGDKAGFASGDAGELRLPVRAIDDPAGARPGAAFGALCLIPGIGETLRINGRVAAIDGDHVRIAVGECYGHCAKALIRSGLWAAQPMVAPDEAGAFIAASRFVALGSISADGHADVSPKGDPAGCMVHLDGDMLWFADRPGNRRMDSFRNILECPSIALTLMIPGASRVAQVRGRARLSTDAAARDRFAVQGKVPLLVVGVTVDALALHDSVALARANLWPIGPVSDINPAKLFVDHIKLNKNEGIGATLTRASLSVPGMTGLMRKGLAKDYRDNLY